MKLYEIEQAIESLIDPETGEILNIEAFHGLHMERDTKIENIALWMKNLNAEAEAIAAERKTLQDRETSVKNKADSLKERLTQILNGEKFSTPRVSISWRSSKSVEVDDGFVEWAKKNAESMIKYKEPEADKAAIKTAIQLGTELQGARIVEKSNIQVR